MTPQEEWLRELGDTSGSVPTPRRNLGDTSGGVPKCGLVHHSNRGLIEISGKDRGSFLQGIFSQDIVKNFPEGGFTYGIFPTVKGKIFADAYVAHVNETFLLDVERFIAPALLAHLNQYLILSEAEVHERTNDYQAISLLGAACRPEESVLKADPSPSAPPRSGVQDDKRPRAFLNSRPPFQEYRLWIKNESFEESVQQLKASGAIPVSESIYETIQIECGIPKLGREIDETTFPQEVGLDDFLNFKKGCFVGAEVLQRIFYQGHVNRSLALFSLPLSFPRRRESNLSLPILQNGAEVGKITAAAFSYRWNQPIALGIVKTAALEAEHPLTASGITLKTIQRFAKEKTA